jgi:hypothetical protein
MLLDMQVSIYPDLKTEGRKKLLRGVKKEASRFVEKASDGVRKNLSKLMKLTKG